MVRVEAESWRPAAATIRSKRFPAGSIFPKKGNGMVADVPSAAEWKAPGSFTEGLRKSPPHARKNGRFGSTISIRLDDLHAGASEEPPPPPGSDPVCRFTTTERSPPLCRRARQREKGLETEAAIEALKTAPMTASGASSFR